MSTPSAPVDLTCRQRTLEEIEEALEVMGNKLLELNQQLAQWSGTMTGGLLVDARLLARLEAMEGLQELSDQRMTDLKRRLTAVEKDLGNVSDLAKVRRQ